MKIAITGHTNIEKSLNLLLIADNGQKYNEDAFKKVFNYISEGLKKYNNPTIISGMARGVDEVFAFYAIKNNLPLILSVPNSIKWHKNRNLSRNMRAQAVYYDKILDYDKLEIYEIKKEYNGNTYPFANFARNQHMVDIADGIFSFKTYDSTGTDDCIKRAKQQQKYLGNLYNDLDYFDDF